MSGSPDGLPPLREVIATHGLAAKKSLGQNFLLDLNLTRRIARAAGPLEGVEVFEVGPGPGGLTRALLIEGAARVVAVERDPRCLPALAEVTAAHGGRLEVIEGDALKVQAAEIMRAPWRVVANLPYYVGTELLVRWLTPPSWPPGWESLTLMFQKEVAERIVAGPGSKTWGRLSVLAQWRCEAQVAFDLPARAFTPPPKVDSAVVVLRPLPEPRFPAEPRMLDRVVGAAFGQRRKMLRQSLKTATPAAAALCEAADVTETLRADDVSLAQFCALARALAAAEAG
ncbi:16S rRNA (adenine(1518)-N(6)/adenine(1519)-N(6))-dimethyltransferase RsmA [Albimonas sp. CAU 1670]|uniref:16S rRNA (adenine(1518)-N(6)/adenine(1519)-N(6))- dimethyltransferase RsmA n=1 Tax=Albimonas sp. CAU 1670 TaxID=3032599 RepID=UPI0023DC290D|nr:16S rRNA (adenine(1518)-N(6)/adenine(1519)-N(6))-dimethyltransferase RsmA [Albimonas sp. CAU 1670]MDF2232623.1 16S rRNA (adenine(1518)-N(6)/adenine(1519)-N(6))-dimethyltransferase RsmA [Albimonas sp. CAU 1670]